MFVVIVAADDDGIDETFVILEGFSVVVVVDRSGNSVETLWPIKVDVVGVTIVVTGTRLVTILLGNSAITV